MQSRSKRSSRSNDIRRHPLEDFFQNPTLKGGSFFWQAGPVGVLLSHGFTATTAEVRPLAKILYEAGYTVSGPLLPGHGALPRDANQYKWQDWASCIQTTYHQLRSSCKEVFIGGESMGALLALYQASSSPEAAGVLLYAPAIKFRSSIIAWIAPILSPFKSVVKKQPSTPSDADALWQGYTVYPLRALGQLIRLQKATFASLPNVRQPLLIIQGLLDRSVHPGAPDLIRNKIGSTVTEIYQLGESGHCVILESERQKVAEITLGFLRRHSQITSSLNLS